MMRELSTLSEREQDNLFYNTLERFKNKELSNLLAMLYLSPRPVNEIKDACPSYARGIDSVKTMRLQGIKVEYKNSLYWLTGMDDGEPVGMVINDIRIRDMAKNLQA